jgi:hypothetical protein
LRSEAHSVADKDSSFLKRYAVLAKLMKIDNGSGTLTTNYQSTCRNIPEDFSFHQNHPSSKTSLLEITDPADVDITFLQNVYNSIPPKKT